MVLFPGIVVQLIKLPWVLNTLWSTSRVSVLVLTLLAPTPNWYIQSKSSGNSPLLVGQNGETSQTNV